MYCSECGAKLPDGVQFCIDCGASVKSPIRSSYDDEISSYVRNDKASSYSSPLNPSSSHDSLGLKILHILKNTFFVLWFSISAFLAFIFLIICLSLFSQGEFNDALIPLAIAALLIFSAVKAYKKIPIPKMNSSRYSAGYHCPNDLQSEPKASSPSSTSLSYRDPSQTKDDSDQKHSSSIGHSNWNISVSFGKSSSQNYQKALTLARSAPQYYEQEYEDTIIHQATYSASPKDYLAFIMLYELVCDWKSSFVFINGQPIDRKIIGQLNYCYGDKCRSTDPRYCFGASYMTENPFGCHRIQISAANHPWWSYYRMQGNKYVLNIDEMLQRIYSAESKYSCCPCFDLDSILDALYKLPRTLTQRQMDALRRDNFGLRM